MVEETNEINNSPWKCTGGLEYGGFHPEVINYQDQCQFCNRHRNEFLPVNSQKKKVKVETIISEEKSLLKQHFIGQFNRYKYGLIALVASALGLNSETITNQLEILTNQFLKSSDQVTNQVTITPAPTTTPTPTKTPQEVIKPPMIVTGLPDNQVIIIKAGSSKVIDQNIALSPEIKTKKYQAQVNEKTIFNFKLNPVTKDREISLSIINKSNQKSLSNSTNGELKEIVLEKGDYIIEVMLMENQPKTYQLSISQK